VVAYNITISNSLNLFGPAPSDKWNQYNWNAFLWGEGTNDLVELVFKVISESITPDTTVTKIPLRIIENSISPTSDMGFERLRDSNGYYHVFPDRTTEGEDRDFATWTQGSPSAASWATAADAATVWS
jgi:hypothetical protein